MFEDVIAEPEWGYGAHVPDDGLDDALDRLLAQTERDIADGLVPDFPPLDGPSVDWAPVDLDQRIPAYGTCEPSGWLALDLDTATADPAVLDDHSLVEAMIGFDRLASWAAARQARLLDELARRRPTDKAPYTARWACVGSEYAPDEVGLALHLSRGSACARIGLARRLLAVLPDTHALWESGRIDTPKARAIDDATVVLPDDLARAVEARVLPKAPEQTLVQLKAALARAVIAVDPGGAEQRHKEARRDRRVAVTAEADGMGTLWAMLTATEAVGAFTWLTRLARGLGSDDPRSMDARRADILAALLNGRLVLNADTTDTQRDGADSAHDTGSDSADSAGADGERGSGDDQARTGGETSDSQTSDGEPGDGQPGTGSAAHGTGTTVGVAGGINGGIGSAASSGRPIQPVTPGKPLIQIVIPHSTLISADDQPAELVGYGPIPASLARETAADGVWRRLVTDPLSGTLLDHGRTTYHPPAGLADCVRARDVYCRGPGCRRRVADGELDHVVAWSEGGETCEKNLDGYCTHHHLLKTHAPGWQVEAHADGRLTWTSPTGHRHTTRPHDYGPEPPGPPIPAPAPPPTALYNPDLDPPPF